jgi:hypothetical protein
VNPYEVYVTYLALKRHFSSGSYDFFKYQGKIKCSQESFKKNKDRLFFERLSRKKKPQEIISFFVSNFAASDTPSTLWIGDIIKKGEEVYLESKRVKESLAYIFEQDLRTLVEKQHLFELVRQEGTKHPKIVRQYLNRTIRFETFFILIQCLGLKSKYDATLDDPIWSTISFKLLKYSPFFTGDCTKYSAIIRKYFK